MNDSSEGGGSMGGLEYVCELREVLQNFSCPLPSPLLQSC